MLTTRASLAAAVAAVLIFGSLGSARAAGGGRRVVVVTLDGVRWQDVFRGAEPALARDEAYAGDPKKLTAEFVDVPDRARVLTPFLHDVVAKQGMFVGDRDHGSFGHVTNPYWFSYPGYNEMFSGKPDVRVNSNDKVLNPNRTVLEWLNSRKELHGKVRAYGSWDLFPWIFNRERSGLFVNAGFEPMAPARTPGEAMLNRVQSDTAAQWDEERFDSFTAAFALESLRHDRPTVLYVSLGETDEFAHGGKYDEYLRSLQRGDRFLAELWTWLQRDPEYAGRTTLVVTCDHGRGEGAHWRDHGSGLDEKHPVAKPEDAVHGSDQTWFAVIGPGVSPAMAARYTAEHPATTSQIAATIVAALGLDWREFDPNVAPPLQGDTATKPAGRP